MMAVGIGTELLLLAAWMLIFLCLCPPGVKSNPVEIRLLKKLTKDNDYEKLSRPVLNVNDSVTVTLGVAIAKVVKLSEIDETLTVNLWYQVVWTDHRLAWNPDDFDGKKSFHIPSNLLWVPDIIQINNAKDSNGRIGKEGENAMEINVIKVMHNGECSWFPNHMSVSYCPVNVQWFPFDVQACKLDYELWGSDTDEVNLTPAIAEPEKIMTHSNGEWKITRDPVRTSKTRYLCCNDYTRISFVIKLSRKSLYYVFNFIIPGVVFSAVIASTFLLQPDSSDRIALSSALLLGITVYQLIISDKLPPTSDQVPILGVYFMFVMIMCGLSVVMSLVVMGLNKCTATMPVWLNRLVKRKQANSPAGNELKTAGAERKEGDERGEGDADWIAAARLLDRLLFATFALCLVIGSVILFIIAAVGHRKNE